MKRARVNMQMSTESFLLLMGEGNPGALSVLMEMVKNNEIMRIFDLDDMNIRGCQIWVGYKDHCHENLAVFIQKVKARDPAMIRIINENNGTKEVAVVSGASFRRTA